MENGVGLAREHDERFIRIEKDVKELRRDMEKAVMDHALLKTRVHRTEEGVSNFRVFQRKSLNHQWFMKGAATVVIGMAGLIYHTVDAALDRFIPAAKILIEYYESQHPQMQGKLPKISQSHSPQEAVNSTQMAHTPEMR